ncbi:uncharacterized protein LOC125654518 [Ostrea edulis]|uniref:uncharacterized protein LOC125654518 n=1 Tax=Ostrea edulis TaxID=37623 RepID=UPI0024AEBEC9|nr:uncharacterized protein LOC125654518 [Ostrea edulis]
MLFLIIFSSGTMPPKNRNKKGDSSVGEQSNSSVAMNAKKRRKQTTHQEQYTVTQSAMPNIDYALLAKHILEQQKVPASETGLAEANLVSQEEVTAPTNLVTEPESTSGLLNPATNSISTDGTLQASAMVPASALGALLDNVFTVSGFTSGQPMNTQKLLKTTLIRV